MIDRLLFGRVSLIVAWFDIWVGVYWNSKTRRLYLMIPFVGIAVDFDKEKAHGSL